MVVTTTPAALDIHTDATMSRDQWISMDMLESHSHERDLGYGRYECPHYNHNGNPAPQSPTIRVSEEDPAFQSPPQQLSGQCHGAGQGVYEASTSPFTDLAYDPIALASMPRIEASDDDQVNGSHAVPGVNGHSDCEPAAHAADMSQIGHSNGTDAFVVEASIKLSYSDDRTFDDENKHHAFDDYTVQGMNDMNFLTHHPVHDHMQPSEYPLHPWHPEYASPYRGGPGLYPPPPSTRSYPVYRFGGDDTFHYSSQIRSVQQLAAREPPLASLPAPANTKKITSKRKPNATKKVETKKAKVIDVTGLNISGRQPTPQELADAKTPRAKAALTVWYDRLTDLIAYKLKHGDCNVPQKYDDNPALGIWVNKQRMEKKFLEEGQKSSMTTAKLKALDEIGFTWAKRKGQPSWDTRFAQLQEYHATQGHCRVPTKFQENPALGRWVSTQRSQYKQYMERRPTHMTAHRKSLLESIGFKWNAMEREDDTD